MIFFNITYSRKNTFSTIIYLHNDPECRHKLSIRNNIIIFKIEIKFLQKLILKKRNKDYFHGVSKNE